MLNTLGRESECFAMLMSDGATMPCSSLLDAVVGSHSLLACSSAISCGCGIESRAWHNGAVVNELMSRENLVWFPLVVGIASATNSQAYHVIRFSRISKLSALPNLDCVLSSSPRDAIPQCPSSTPSPCRGR